LCIGAAIVLRGPALWDSETFYRELIDKRITVVDLTTAYWFLLVQDFARHGSRDYGALRRVHVGGEAMPPEGIQAWRQAGAAGIELFNLYGPTEAVVTASISDRIAHASGQQRLPSQIPIGKPVAGRHIHVLDGNLAPVAPGVAGELCIGGELLARGYLNRGGLTAERFIADPFGEEGGRLYRTGDLARWRADGQIEYLGRLDHQVKIRGFRIELGEIEAQLLSQPQIREAVVIAGEGSSGARLVAYVCPHAGMEVDTGMLREALGKALPDYMMPSAIVVLERLPLNPNGKVDRKALPEPEYTHIGNYEAPQGEVEQMLADIWSEVLGIPQVGRKDNFFEVGGHSLAILQVQQKLQQVLSVSLPLRLYFEKPLFADIASVIQEKTSACAKHVAQDELLGMSELLDLLESEA
jgi:acyl-CoA synthetase (AMP-forming)/AMP-acid ligase II